MVFWSYLLAAICFVTGGMMVGAPALSMRLYGAFPRSKPAGYLLSTVAWVWAGYALWSMGIDFLEPFKQYIPFAVLACIPLTWFWMENLLPPRALGGILVLFPYELLHVARAHSSPWRLVLVTIAYVCIVKGMILLLYPWKFRQVVEWLTARSLLWRVGGAVKIVLGILLVVLGATVFGAA